LYCLGGIILTIVLGLDDEITKKQRNIAVLIFILAGVISIGTIKLIRNEAVPKLIDCALMRTVLDHPFAVSQAFSL
jgi:sugar phosphate permease